MQVISATLLSSRPVEISNVPEIRDVKNLIELLRQMGVKVTRHERGRYTFQADDIDPSYILSDDFISRASQLRGSVLVVGPLLGRFGSVYFPKPGIRLGAGRLTPISRDSSTSERNIPTSRKNTLTC